MTSTTTNTQEMKNNTNILKEITPEKSPSDPRDYKIITLSNDLECILVSDPEAEKYVKAKKKTTSLYQPNHITKTQKKYSHSNKEVHVQCVYELVISQIQILFLVLLTF